MRSASGQGRGEPRVTMAERGLPVQVLEGDEQRARSGSRPTSWTTTMFGWERRAAIRASAKKRRSNSSARGGRREGELDGLEGDGPPEHGVEGLVDDAHHPAPDLAPDVVAADGGRLASSRIPSAPLDHEAWPGEVRFPRLPARREPGHIRRFRGLAQPLGCISAGPGLTCNQEVAHARDRHRAPTASRRRSCSARRDRGSGAP